jgi:flagellar biosynthetic protein FliQ
MITLLLAGPVLILSLVIGILISLVQAATQINEATLTFVPKAIGIGVLLVILGSWMLQQMIVFTAQLFNSLPELIH